MRPVPHPSDLPFLELGPQHLADPDLWSPPPVRVIDGAESHLNLRYAVAGGWRPLRLDLHLPVRGDGPVPVVVYAHGGSFIGGVKELGPWASLPRHGIAVASIEYRLAGEANWPEPVEDVLAAIRWVRSHADDYGLDPRRVAGWGSSAGGYLMARAALADDHPIGRPVGNNRHISATLDALVLHYSPADFATLLQDALDPTPEAQEGVVDVVSVHLGMPMAEADEVLEAASIVACVARSAQVPPLHVTHGDDDHRCGLDQARRLVAAWGDAGVEASLVVVPGADHAAPVFSTPRVVGPAIEFLTAAWNRAAADDDRPTTDTHELRALRP